ncbi:NELlike 1 (Silurana), partial [Caligus rogercresseyi]
KGDWHKIFISTKNGGFYIINAYGPNVKCTSFYQAIINQCKYDLYPLLVVGDLNVDLYQLTVKHPNFQILSKLLHSLELHDVIKFFSPNENVSWRCGSKSSRIDLALSSSSIRSKIVNARYRSQHSSDHKLIEIDFLQVRQKRRFRVPKCILNDNDFIDKLKKRFIKLFKESFKPKKLAYLLSHIVKSTSLQCFRKKRQKEVSFQKNIEEMLDNSSIFLRSISSDFTHLFRVSEIAEDNFNQKNIKENSPSRRLKNLFQKDHATTIIKKIIHEGKTVSNPKDILKLFHGRFQKLLGGERVNFPRSRMGKNLIFTKSAIEEYIKKKLKEGKATGPDGICGKIFIECIDEILPFLVEFGKSMEIHGKLPKPLTKGRISLIPKKGSATDLNNWRPITVLNESYRILSG